MKRTKIVVAFLVLVAVAASVLVLVRTREQTRAQENFDTLHRHAVEEQLRAAEFIAEQARIWTPH